MAAAHLWTGVLSLLLGGAFGAFRLIHRYRNRCKYALRHAWGRVLIGVSAIFSGLIFVCLQLSALRLDHGISPTLNGILLAFVSSLISVGVLTVAPVPIRKTSGVHIFVTASTWLNGILEEETDRLVAQDVTEIALRIEADGVSVKILQDIGNYLIQASVPAGKKRSAELARVDALVSAADLPGLIRRLMDYCEPEWLSRLAKSQMQKHSASASVTELQPSPIEAKLTEAQEP